MASQLKSMLGGAAVAALLIIPAAAGNGDWSTGPWQGFGVHEVKVDSLVGRLRVEAKQQAQVAIQVSGKKDRVDRVKVYQSGDTLVVEGQNNGSVWDWHTWFDFSDLDQDPNEVDVHVVVPKGTSLKVDDMVGDATIGDTEGTLKFDAVDSSNSTIGRVKEAHISMAGSGKVQMSDVMGDLHLDIAGSGKVKVRSARSVDADVAGSGTADLGDVAGGISLDIAGSGDFSAQRVNGPVSIDIVGAGSVNIAQGTANPLKIDIMGAGNFVFGGEAVDPHITALGSGSVKLRSYRGKPVFDGMADVKVGPEGFPPPPAPPAPVAPKAPPAPPAPKAPPAPVKSH
jgi:hypothetical protein